MEAVRTSENISIDGDLSEPAWNTATPATDFIMFAPDNGKPIGDERRTEVRILYDDNAIYVGAKMYDENPAGLLKEMTQRDNFGTAEHFGIFLNGFNDGQQDFRFFLSSAGVQMDCVATEALGEDFSWDAIWSGNVTLTAFGWVAEMKIPYAALRFSDAKKQTWGVNLYREFRRDRHQHTWNHIDTKIGAELVQAGILEGIENIEPPTRLFFIPYTSYYSDFNKSDTQHTFKAGLDIKYGINDSFTLDAILIPDFGQTRFDNVELNLGPFEQQFNENRPFFTEGTDLFNKGNLLYSRRIGGGPSLPLESNDQVTVVSYPATVDLLNAIKVSGRTKSGLGVGFLNAITKKTYATVRDNTTQQLRDVVVEPVSNFNVLVLDQRFGNNSSVSFVNTNVTRDGNFRDANVSALVFDLNTKKNTYKASGDFKYSYINEHGNADNREGINTSLYLAETTGNYRFGLGGEYISKDFDNNDLGINFQTHYHAIYGDASYRILQSNKTFNSFSVNTNFYTEFDNITGKIQQGNANINVSSTTVRNNYYGFGLTFRPLKTYDFYEPRFDGRFVHIPRNLDGFFYFSSNYNKKLAVDIQPSFILYDDEKRESWSMFVSPRYRFTDRITAILSFNFNRQNNNVGYIDDTYEAGAAAYDIYFAKRNRTTYTFSAGGKYSINKDMTLNLNARYYWSFVENREFFLLTPDGDLTTTSYTENKNSDFNTWNLDLSYSWWFAPGSQVSILYRNNADTFSSEINRNFSNNFSNLFRDNLAHVFSISIRYYIDYNQAKNWF